MQTKNLLKISLAALAVGLFAGCQTVQNPAETKTTPTPTGQSNSTVEITNTTGLDQISEPQEKIIKPEDISQADRDAFQKADAVKNPALCDSITVDAYKQFCVKQASDANAQPLQAETPTQQDCKSTKDVNGVKTCVNFEE